MIAVYADVLVCLNILFTYIFLVCTRVWGNMATHKWGVCLSSVVGGLSALIVLAGDIGLFFSLLFKATTSTVIVLLSFLPSSLKCFLKLYFRFLGVSIIFGGAMYFIEITLKPHNIMYFNGTVYFDMDIKYLVGCTFIIYGVFLFADFLIKRKAMKSEIYKVKIGFRDTTVEISGFVDSGNNLTDGLTGKTVFVGELKVLSPLFTYEEIEYFKSSNIEEIPDSIKGKIRFIPCHTINGENLMPVFTPNVLVIEIKDKKINCSKDFSVAIVNKDLGGEYNILLNKAIYDLV